jgi:hypothetical protein
MIKVVALSRLDCRADGTLHCVGSLTPMTVLTVLRA